MKTYSGAPYAAMTHSALQRRLLRNASFPPRTPQIDALRLRAAPLVPEILLFLAEDPMLLWARLEADEGSKLSAPYWATAWTGGQAIARYVLDNPGVVAGRRVLDVASGSGLVAIAAIEANANANGERIVCDPSDLTEGDGGDAEVILAGDCLYSAEVAERMLPFIARAAARGAIVMLGDPGRGFAPPTQLETLTTYHLPAMSVAEYGQHEQASVLIPVASVPAA